MPRRGLKVIAEFSIHPIGSGTSVSKYVFAALKAISGIKGVRYQTNPMSTVLEADKLDTIFNAVSAAHEAVFEAGGNSIKIDINSASSAFPPCYLLCTRYLRRSRRILIMYFSFMHKNQLSLELACLKKNLEEITLANDSVLPNAWQLVYRRGDLI